MALSARKFIALLAVSALVVLVAVVFAGGSTTTEAHAGQYAQFPGPGSGYINVTNDAGLNPTSAITLEAWVFLTDESTSWGSNSGRCPTIAGKGYTTAYWLGVCNGHIRFYPRNDDSFDGTGTVPLNTWTHIAATFDGTTLNTYINGVLDGTSTDISGPVGTNSQDFRIGEDTDWDSTPMGAIDEVRLWGVARTEAEIAASMNTTITGATAGLIGVWNMEGNGNDDSGNGYDGTTHGDIEFLSAEPPTAVPTDTLAPTETASPTPTPSPSPTPNPNAFLKGDLDCNHVVDANDIMPYLKYSAGIGPRPASSCNAAPAAAPQGGAPFGQWLNLGASTGGYVSIPDDPALNPTGAITIEMLVYVNSYVTGDGSSFCQSLVGKGFVTAYWLGLCYGHLRFYPRGSGSAHDSAGILPLRQWTHVAVVADATTLTFYINGALDHQFTNAAAPLTTNTTPVEIASDADYDYRPWAAIDEVRIWNIARSQSDIQSTMGAPIVPPQTGLVAAYQFEGNTDDSTGAHNGTAAGTLDIGNNLPPVNWNDLDCDGYMNLPGDWFAVLFHAAGLTYTLPPGCEPLGTPES